MAVPEAQLVTWEEARAHLRILSDDFDPDLALKMWQAEEKVLDFVERIDTGWTPETVPAQIKAAILMVLEFLWENRGAETDRGDPLSPAARSMLRMFRDPVIA